MNNRNWGIYLIPFLAALTIYFPLTSGNKPPVTISTPSPVQGEAQPATKPEKDLSHGAAALLAQFLGRDSVVAEDFENYELDFLIATVPDPIDSSLGYMFDRHVSAIQLAGQAAGYVPDRFDLPWREKEDAAIQQGRAIARYKLDRLGSPKSEEDSKLPRLQREPGVLLFRGAKSPVGKPQNPRVLIVFLVGETPTIGINKTALSDAFDQFKNLCGWGKNPQCTKVRLLAPTFSGSADSLKIAMEGWPELEFEVVSGTATAITPEQIAQLKAHNASFHATVWPDDKLLPQFFEYLTSSPVGAKKTEIAMLIERASAYGQAQIPQSPQFKSDARDKQTQVSKSKPDEQKDEIKPLILTYPLHISQLRQAAEKAKGSTKELPMEAPSLRPQNLRLSLEEAIEAKDVVPPFSQFEPFSVELVLSNILTTISREGIRYLGLFSTDVRDQIFLANKIRELAPNVVLFTSNADLIYLHSDVNLDFRGMLLITTYPLFSRNQLWTYPFQAEKFRLQFPTDTAQGVFNAALALLEKPELMLEYGRPFDFGQGHNDRRAPPIWLSAVGKNGIWPIRLLSATQSSRNYLVSGSPIQLHGDQTRDQTGWFVSPATFFLLICLGAALLLISLGLLAQFPPHWLWKDQRGRIARIRKIWLLNNLSGAAFRENPPQRRLYLLSFCILVLILSLVVNRVLVRMLICNPFAASCGAELNPLGLSNRFLFDNPVFFEVVNWMTVLFLEVPILLAAIGVIFGLRERAGWRQRLSMVVDPIASIPLVILVFGVWYSFQVSRLDPPDALLFYLRMLNPGNGLSPLVPLIFVGAAGLFWLISHLRRLRLLEEFPARYFDEHSLSKIERAQSYIMWLLLCPSLSLPYSILVLLFVGLPCSYLFLWKLTPALEEPVFYALFGTAFVMVYIALSFLFWRLWLTWWSTRDLLRRIASHRMHGAYNDLVKKFPRTPRLSFSNPSTIFSALEFSTEQARGLVISESRVVRLARDWKMKHVYVDKFEELKLCVMGAQQDTLRSDQKEACSKWLQAVKLRSRAHARLSQASTIVVHILKPYWSSMASGSTKDEESWYVSAEYFIAGRMAVFIHHLFLHLENLLFSVMAGLLLMLLAVSSYPFQPGDQLLLFNWAIILTAVVLTMVIFVQINRNSSVSLLTTGEPGKVTWNQDFIMKLLIYGVVPILALVGAQFPESLKSIVSWFGGSQGLR